MDIALEITSVTEKVILSHHDKNITSIFPSNLTQKPDVEKLDGNTAYFKDGTQEEIDVVFLCTGEIYLYSLI